MNLRKTFISLSFLSLIGLQAADSNSIKHYGFSALFGFTSETIIHKNYIQMDDLKKISYATLLGATPGLIKELSDDHFSSSDMVFNLAGALSGALLSNYINNNTTIFISHDERKDATKINLAYKF